MNNPATVISLASIIIALLTFTAAMVGMNRTQSGSANQALRSRIDVLETELAICQREGREMMRELLAMRRGGH